jgi:hypothetical protein
MGYEDNAFNTKEGKDILKQNFRLVFAPSRKDPTQIESKDLQTITKHFVSNTKQIINNIKRFAKGYTPIKPSDAYESGIYVCPHCQRRDWMWLWEYKDLGYWDQNSISTGNLNFNLTSGFSKKDYRSNTFPSIAHVTCNTVNYCPECSITSLDSTVCPNCSGDTKKVGCGKDSYAIHYTPPITASTYGATQITATNNSTHKYVEKNISETSQQIKYQSGIRTAFEYQKESVAPREFTNDSTSSNIYSSDYPNFEQKRVGIPSLVVGYSSSSLIKTNDNGTMGKPLVERYPISPMRMLISNPPARYKCNHRDHWIFGKDGGWYSSSAYAITSRSLGESYWCDTVDPETGRQHGNRYTQKDLSFGRSDLLNCRITSPNPLPEDAIQGRTFGGKPIYRITLQYESNVNYRGSDSTNLTDDSNWSTPFSSTVQKSLYLPMVFSLMEIPQNVTEVDMNPGGREPCPNDPAIEEIVGSFKADLTAQEELPPETRIDKTLTVEKLIDEGRQDVVDILNQYARGFINDEISPLLLENTSNRGILLNKKYRGWVDLSDPIENAGGFTVPRKLFLNNKVDKAKTWLKDYCRNTLFNNDIAPSGKIIFGNFGWVASARNRRSHTSQIRSRTDDRVLHKPNYTWLTSTRHIEPNIIPLIVGTNSSITTSQSPWSAEFKRKLKGTKVAGSTTPMKPYITSSPSSFLPLTLLAYTSLPVAGIGGTVSKAIDTEIKDLNMLHYVATGLSYVDDEMMTSYTIMRCETCNEIVDSGGVLPYRIGRGEVDAAGKVTGINRNLTQEYFDIEQAHETNGGGKYKPYVSQSGANICPAWGIDEPAANKYGKEMLLGGVTGQDASKSLTISVRKEKDTK